MANQARMETLESNREKHIREYNEAMAGYKSLLLSRIHDVHKSVLILRG